MNIGTLEGVLRLRDDLSKGLAQAANNIQSATKFPRQLQAALVDLEKQMLKVAKTPSIQANSATALKALGQIQAQNRALAENIATLKRGPAAVQALNNQRDIQNRLLAVGVTRESTYGKQLEQSIRLQQRYKQELADLNKVQKSFADRLTDTGRTLAFYVGPQLIRTVTVPLVALGGSIIKFSSDFESSFAGVRKTVDASEEEFSQLAQGFRDLSKTIPVNVNELNQIGEAAGQLGIRKDAILGFTRTVADMGATTNLSTDAAATGLARLANITQMSQDKFSNLGSSIVDLGNKFAGTESEILEMGLRIAGAGEIAGLSEGQILGVATALTSVGVEAEAGGTAVQKVLIRMTKAVVDGNKELGAFAATAGMSAKQFADVFKRDAGEAFRLFVEGLSQQGQQAFKTLDELHLKDARLTRAFISLATAGDLLNNTMKVGEEAFRANAALTAEAEKRYKTFQSQLTLTWNKLKDVAITLGDSLLPILRDLLESLEPLLKALANLAQKFNDLPKSIKVVILLQAALVAAIGPVIYIIGQLALAFGSILTFGPQLLASAPGLASAAAKIGSILGTTGPIGLAIVALGGLIAYEVNQWKKRLSEIQNVVLNFDTGDTKFVETVNKMRSASRRGLIDDETLQKSAEELGRLKREIVDLVANKIPEAKSKSGHIFSAEAKQAKELLGIYTNQLNLDRTRVKELERLFDKVKFLNKVSTGAKDKVSPLPLPPPEASKHAIELANDLENLRKELTKTTELNKKVADSFNKASISTTADAVSVEKQTDSIKRANFLYSKYLDDVDKFGIKAAESLKVLRTEAYDSEQAAKKAESEWEKRLKRIIDIKEGFLKNQQHLADSIIDWKTKTLEQSRDLTLQIVTAEEEHNRQLLKAITLYNTIIDGQRAISKETFEAAMRQSARPLFTEDQQFNRQIVDDIINEFNTAGTKLKNKLALIERAFVDVSDSVEMVRLKELALSEARQQYIADALNQWSNFFSTLSDLFGGTTGSILSEINNWIIKLQRLQQAYQSGKGIWTDFLAGTPFGKWVTGKFIGNPMTGGNSFLGGSGAGFAGAASFAAGAAIVIHWLETKGTAWAKSVIQFGGTSGIQIGEGSYNPQGAAIGNVKNSVNQVLEQVNGILKVVREFIQSLGGEIDKTLGIIGQMSIVKKGQGKKTHWIVTTIEGIVRDFGRDMEAAMEFATIQAIKATPTFGLSPEILQAIHNSIAETIEEFNKDIETALNVVHARLGDLGSQVFDIFREFDKEITSARSLGLATDSLVAAREREMLSLRNQLLGIDDSASKALEALISFNAGISEVTAGATERLRRQIEETQAAIDAMGTGPRTLTTEDGRVIHETQEMWDAAVARLRNNLAAYIDELDKIPKALSDQEINMGIFDALFKYLRDNKKYQEEAVKWAKFKVQIEFELIKARLMELGKWEEWAVMFNDAFNAAMTAAGQIVTGGGKGSKSGTTKQDVRDFIADRSYQLAVSKLTEYERAISDLNKEYDPLIAATGKDKDLLAQLIALRDKEAVTIAQQAKQDIVGRFRDFLGLTTTFDNIRKTASDLIKDIEGSPFGNARKAAMIGRVMEDVERQIQVASNQMASGLLGDLSQWITDESVRNEALRMQAILNYNLAMETARITYAKLLAEGKMTNETRKVFEHIFNWFDNNKNKLPGGSDWDFGGIISVPDRAHDYRWAYQDQVTIQNDINEQLNRAKDLLKKYNDDGLDPLTKELQEIKSDFDIITSALGNTTEIFNIKNKAIERAIDNFLEPLNESIEKMDFSSNLSTLTGEQQFFEIQRKFRELIPVATFKDRDRLIELAELYRQLGSDYTAGSGFRFIDKEIKYAYDLFKSRVPEQITDILGSSNNPMSIESPTLQGAIVNGNVVLFEELRKQTDNLIEIKAAIKEEYWRQFESTSGEKIA